MPDSPSAPDDLPTRVAILEEIARNTHATLDRMDRRLDAIERRFDRRLEAIERNQRADFRWLLGIMLGSWASLLGVMAHGFHWF